jgi:hypothetical protein
MQSGCNLRRQVKRPHLYRRDRFWLLVLVSRVPSWKQALLIIQPDLSSHSDMIRTKMIFDNAPDSH